MAESDLLQERFTMPNGTNAALELRGAQFADRIGRPYELLVGHCAVAGTISDTDSDAIFNFYVGLDPEPTGIAPRALILGIYRMPQFEQSKILQKSRSGLTDGIDILTRSIIRHSQELTVLTVRSEAAKSARHCWQQLIVNDFLTKRGQVRKHNDLLSTNNQEAVSEAAYLYARRSKNRYSTFGLFVAQKAWQKFTLETV